MADTFDILRALLTAGGGIYDYINQGNAADQIGDLYNQVESMSSPYPAADRALAAQKLRGFMTGQLGPTAMPGYANFVQDAERRAAAAGRFYSGNMPIELAQELSGAQLDYMKFLGDIAGAQFNPAASAGILAQLGQGQIEADANRGGGLFSAGSNILDILSGANSIRGALAGENPLSGVSDIFSNFFGGGSTAGGPLVSSLAGLYSSAGPTGLAAGLGGELGAISSALGASGSAPAFAGLGADLGALNSMIGSGAASPAAATPGLGLGALAGPAAAVAGGYLLPKFLSGMILGREKYLPEPASTRYVPGVGLTGTKGNPRQAKVLESMLGYIGEDALARLKNPVTFRSNTYTGAGFDQGDYTYYAPLGGYHSSKGEQEVASRLIRRSLRRDDLDTLTKQYLKDTNLDLGRGIHGGNTPVNLKDLTEYAKNRNDSRYQIGGRYVPQSLRDQYDFDSAP